MHLGVKDERVDAIMLRIEAEARKARGEHPRPDAKTGRERRPRSGGGAPPRAQGDALLRRARAIDASSGEGTAIAGVYWNRRTGRWQVQTRFKSKTIYLGQCDSRVEAIFRRLRSDAAVAAGHHPSSAAGVRAADAAAAQADNASAGEALPETESGPSSAAAAAALSDNDDGDDRDGSSIDAAVPWQPTASPRADPVGARMSPAELQRQAHALAETGRDVTGVRWNAARGEWHARISFQGRQMTLCYSTDRAEAIEFRLRGEVDKAAGRLPRVAPSLSSQRKRSWSDGPGDAFAPEPAPANETLGQHALRLFREAYAKVGCGWH